MTRSEWQEFKKANTNHELDDAPTASGSASFHVLDPNTTSMEIYGQSITDKPNKGKVQTKVYGKNEHDPLLYFRFKDIENYYFTQLSRFDPFGNIKAELMLKKRVGDNITQVDNVSFGTPPLKEKSWEKITIKFWVDTGDDVRVRWEKMEGEVDPEWKQIGDDLVDRDPDIPEGGGIGIGGNKKSSGGSGNDVWFDETKIFYPE